MIVFTPSCQKTEYSLRNVQEIDILLSITRYDWRESAMSLERDYFAFLAYQGGRTKYPNPKYPASQNT